CPLVLHSFPTRRSSDLRNNLPEVQINGNLIFINQHASLSGVPNTEIKCMMPNEIRNYLRNIHIHSRSHKSERIINAFLKNDLERSEEHTSELQSRFDLV